MLEFYCPTCEKRSRDSWEEVAERLRRSGMLKRTKEDDPAILTELAITCASQLSCSECRRAGLAVRRLLQEELDQEEWGDVRLCEMCRNVIPPQRLEFLPDAVLCVACQAKADAGEILQEREFCPYCGAVMTMRQRSRGVTSYRMVCTECGK